MEWEVVDNHCFIVRPILKDRDKDTGNDKDHLLNYRSRYIKPILKDRVRNSNRWG